MPFEKWKTSFSERAEHFSKSSAKYLMLLVCFSLLEYCQIQFRFSENVKDRLNNKSRYIDVLD